MTLVNIDLRNQGYETVPDDRVIFYSLLVREGDFGTISTAPVEVELVDGKASVDLAPGPVGVQIIAGQVADTRIKIGEVPPSGTTTLNAVMMITPAYTPALQAQFIKAIQDAQAKAIGLIDAEVTVAIDAEVGEFKDISVEALSRAKSAEGVAAVADAKAGSANSTASNAVGTASNAAARVTALEALSGLSPESPTDGQTANLLSQPATLTRNAVNATIRGATGIYPVEQYGALGDGVTDDTTAIQAAIHAADAAGGGTVLFRPGRTYKIVSIDLIPGVILDGYGATLTRPDMAPRGSRMLTTQRKVYSGIQDSVKKIVIRGLVVDGNFQNQGPYINYEREQESMIFLYASSQNSGRVQVNIDDVTVRGGVSDGIHVYENVDVSIRNLTGIDCFRGALTISGAWSSVRVNGAIMSGEVLGASLTAEIGSAGYGGTWRTDVSITGWVDKVAARKNFNFAGYDGAIMRLSDSQILSGMHVGGGDSIGGPATIEISRSVIHTLDRGIKNTIWNPADVVFSDCIFYADQMNDNRPLHSAWYVNHNISETGFGYSNLRFEGCEWVDIDSDDERPRCAVTTENILTSPLTHKITIEGGRISDAFDEGVNIKRGGVVELRGVHIDASVPVRVWDFTDEPYHVVLDNIRLGDNVGAYISISTDTGSSMIENRNIILPQSKNIVQSFYGAWASLRVRGSRTIMLEAPITTPIVGFVGDRARLATPVPGETFEWVCTKTGPATGSAPAIWKPLLAIPA